MELNADAWVDRYADGFFHSAKARVQDGAVAEDLVQETFLAAVRSQARCKGRSSEKTWLFGILKHKIIDGGVLAVGGLGRKKNGCRLDLQSRHPSFFQ